SAVLQLEEKLLPALEYLHTSLLGKSVQVSNFVKTGRTHLMDAMPVTLTQELEAWTHQIEANYVRLRTLMPQLLQLAQGGTAVGTGINAHPAFAGQFAEQLAV